MLYGKAISDGYIMAISRGTKPCGEEITESEYNEILAIIRNKPPRTDTKDYRLKLDLTWEEYQIDPPDPDPELDDSELLDILIGGAE